MVSLFQNASSVLNFGEQDYVANITMTPISLSKLSSQMALFLVYWVFHSVCVKNGLPQNFMIQSGERRKAGQAFLAYFETIVSWKDFLASSCGLLYTMRYPCDIHVISWKPPWLTMTLKEVAPLRPCVATRTIWGCVFLGGHADSGPRIDFDFPEMWGSWGKGKKELAADYPAW